jgi:excisionase family DNA binding protein
VVGLLGFVDQWHFPILFYGLTGGKVMENRWLSVDEIANHLGIKRDTVYKWISERQMPGHKIGRLWKFDKSDVDEWVRGGRADDKRRKK